MHSWDDDDDEYEALGLRVLLKAAVSPEDYKKATKKRCIDLGVTEANRQSRRDDQVWHRTFDALKKALGRNPTTEEHAAVMALEECE